MKAALLSLLSLLPLAACAAPGGRWSSMSPSQRLAALDHIAETCRLDRSTFGVEKGGELWFRPRPDADYASVDCALVRLKAIGAATRLGFVGNVTADAKR